MSELTGTGVLIRAAVRRDRVRMLVWMVAIVVLVLVTAASTKAIYPTPESLRAAALAGQSAAAVVVNGPPLALDTMGGQIAFQVNLFTLIVVGLMSVFMLGRLTRAEEESGRTELLLSTALGRHAPLAAALVVVTVMNAVVAAGVGAGLLALDLPAAGCLALALGLLLLGLLMAGLTATVAQISENTRVVYGSAGALLGASFVVRGIGDVGDGTLSWLSPIGWSQKLRPWAEEQWAAAAVPLVAAAVLVGVAWVLADHRDVGAGLVAPRPGPPCGSPALATPGGLALRLQRATIVGWLVGVGLLAVTYGSLAKDVDKFVADNPQMEEYFRAFGGGASLTDAFFAQTFLTLALLTSGFVIQAALRLHAEEAGGRTETLLATPQSRWSLVGGHLAMALAGGAVILAVNGVAVGVTYGVTVGDYSAVPSQVVASLAYLPAVSVLAGVALALFGLWPRAALGTWAVFAGSVLVGFLADLLKLPAAVRNLSPFEHVPRLAVEPVRAQPLLVLTILALALIAAGLWGFRHRDTPA